MNESFLTRWTRVIKTMWPDRCPRCRLTRYEADGMDCCDFARSPTPSGGFNPGDDDIRKAFRSGAAGYLDAIVALESRGVSSKDAEAIVIGWESEPRKSWRDALNSKDSSDG